MGVDIHSIGYRVDGTKVDAMTSLVLLRGPFYECWRRTFAFLGNEVQNRDDIVNCGFFHEGLPKEMPLEHREGFLERAGQGVGYVLASDLLAFDYDKPLAHIPSDDSSEGPPLPPMTYREYLTPDLFFDSLQKLKDSGITHIVIGYDNNR